jgi:hypothetical protein
VLTGPSALSGALVPEDNAEPVVRVAAASEGSPTHEAVIDAMTSPYLAGQR